MSIKASKNNITTRSFRNTLAISSWVNLSVLARRQIHKCALFKCSNNLFTEYLSGYFVRNFSIHSYNTRRKTNLYLPEV